MRAAARNSEPASADGIPRGRTVRGRRIRLNQQPQAAISQREKGEAQASGENTCWDELMATGAPALTFFALILPFVGALAAPFLTRVLKYNAAWVLAGYRRFCALHPPSRRSSRGLGQAGQCSKAMIEKNAHLFRISPEYWSSSVPCLR